MPFKEIEEFLSGGDIMPKDYYLVLGITSDATLDEIKDAYRRLAKTFHPDRYGDNHSPFLAVQEAYAILSDPIKRQTHDLERLSQKKIGDPGMGNVSGLPQANTLSL